MINVAPQSPVAKPKSPERLKIRRRSASWNDLLEDRLVALAEKTPFNREEIARMCILRSLPDFEADPALMMRPAPRQDEP